MRCDLLILGDTPDAWAAAQDAARLGARVVVLRPEIDARRDATGIAAVLAAFEQDSPEFLTAKPTCGPVRPSDLWQAALAAHQRHVTASARELGIAMWRGLARLTGPDTAELFAHGAVTRFQASLILIAVGTTARRPIGLSLERSALILPEEIPHRHEIPPRLAVFGGNRTARACARLFRTAGSDVTIIDAHGTGFDASSLHDEVIECRPDRDGVRLRLASERAVQADAVLFAANRTGATDRLGLAEAGLEADDRGRLWCDDLGMTWVPTIAAAGEVIGYPRGLREDRQRIRKTIAAHLGLRESDAPATISIRIEPAAETPATPSEGTRVRTKPRPRPALRVFNGR